MGPNYNSTTQGVGFNRNTSQATTPNKYDFDIGQILARIKEGNEDVAADHEGRSYEYLEAELEFVTENLAQNEEIGMEQKVALYNYGRALHAVCEAKLNNMEQIVLKAQKGENGEPETVPFQ